MAKKQNMSDSLGDSIPVRVTKAKAASRKDGNIPIENSKRLPAVSDETDDLAKLLYPDKGKKEMGKLQQGNSRRRIIIRIIIVLLALFAVTLGGFLFFTKRQGAFEEQIVFSMTGVQTAASGQAITLTVEYANNEQVGLRDVELSMQYPDGFTFQSASPSPQDATTWFIGDLRAGAGGKIQITGQLIGDLDAIKSFTGTMTYLPDNFNYAFTKEASFSVTIASSALSVDFDAPLRVVPDKEFEVSVTYTNTSSETLQRVQLVLQTPDGYTLASTDPETTKTTWQSDSLTSAEQKKVTLRGSVSGNVGDQKRFTARIGVVNDQGAFVVQAEKNVLILLIKSGLTLQVDPSTKIERVAEWGETIAYTVSYVNDGDVPLSDVKISLAFIAETSGGSAFDLIKWDDITSADKGVIQEKSIVWMPDAVESLKTVKPADKGSFIVSIPVVDLPETLADGNEEFHILATASSEGSAQGGSEPFTSQSEQKETIIATALDLVSEARYYSTTGEAIGSGPLPPTVGEKTTYVVVWTVTNASNDVEDVVVTTTLPENVEWAANSTISAGDPISYNVQTRTVSWKVNRIPAGAGESFPAIEARFSIHFTPDSTDVGTVGSLVNATRITATDTFADIARSDDAAVLTTDLTGDSFAEGNGTIQAAS